MPKDPAPELLAALYGDLCSALFSFALSYPTCIHDESFWHSVNAVIVDAMANSAFKNQLDKEDVTP